VGPRVTFSSLGSLVFLLDCECKQELDYSELLYNEITILDTTKHAHVAAVKGKIKVTYNMSKTV
jgi:hypothetical protein